MVFSLQVCSQDISLSRGCIVTSIMMNKNRQVCLSKQETIGTIFNWGISPRSLCPQNIA